MKLRKTPTLLAVMIMLSVFNACGEKADDIDEDYQLEASGIDDIADTVDDEDIQADPAHKPVYNNPYTGNFTDIDMSVFEESDYAPEDIVGRWYEDGWSNGYYLELYGDGTWKFFGEKTECGYYTIEYSSFLLVQGYYDVDVGMAFLYRDNDGSSNLSIGSLSWAGNYKPRTKDVDVYFRPESESKPCEDLNSFYEQQYPYAWLEGTWYPVENDAESDYYEISANGIWNEVINAASIEIGNIELTGIGIYESEGANFGALKTFEYTGDGYLYINGEAYERFMATSDSSAPESATGTFLYYDIDKGDFSDRGFVFNSDWTFRSLPDTPSSEHGTFIFLGDYMLLYDKDGNQVHKFVQDSFSAERGYITGENLEDLYLQE